MFACALVADFGENLRQRFDLFGLVQEILRAPLFGCDPILRKAVVRKHYDRGPLRPFSDRAKNAEPMPLTQLQIQQHDIERRISHRAARGFFGVDDTQHTDASRVPDQFQQTFHQNRRILYDEGSKGSLVRWCGHLKNRLFGSGVSTNPALHTAAHTADLG
jgi:hypothetical protein